MRSVVPRLDTLVQKAVAHYWRTLNKQSEKQKSGDADRGGRAAVTGGKQMDGFCDLVNAVLSKNDLPEASIFIQDRLELPGYFRPTKRWDMLVVHEEHLVAAVDLWTSYREGAFGKEKPRPWLGWVMLLEKRSSSTTPVAAKEPHFRVFPEYRKASYAKRYELLLRRLMLEKQYDSAALLLATEKEGPRGVYEEPASDLTMKRLLASLAGHVVTYV